MNQKEQGQASSSKQATEGGKKILEQTAFNSKTKAKFQDFSQFEKLDKNVIQSALKDVVKDSQNPEQEAPKALTGKRARNGDPNLEQKFRNLSIESGGQQNEKVVVAGNARQKLDHDGNAIRIEKKLTQKR